MDINKTFSGDYIKADDFAEGETRTLTIKHVSMEKVGDESKPVMSFLEVTQGLVLNKTNASFIAANYTSETENWRDKKIVLYVTWVDFAGKQVKGLRVRIPPRTQQPSPGANPTGYSQPPPPPPPPQQQAPSPPPDEEEWWVPDGNTSKLMPASAIRQAMKDQKGPSWVARKDAPGQWVKPEVAGLAPF